MPRRVGYSLLTPSINFAAGFHAWSPVRILTLSAYARYQVNIDHNDTRKTPFERKHRDGEWVLQRRHAHRLNDAFFLDGESILYRKRELLYHLATS